MSKTIAKRTIEIGRGLATSQSGRNLAGLEAVANLLFFSNFATNPARNWPDSRPDSGKIVPSRISFEIPEFSIFGQIFEKS